MTYEITEVQVFKGWDDQLNPTAEKTYSANVAVDDKFMIQLGADGEWDIPHSDEACWNDENEQDQAHESLNAADLVEALNAVERVQHLVEQEIFDN